MPIIHRLSVLLFLIVPEIVFAQEGVTPQDVSKGEVFVRMIPMFLVVFGIFFLLVIRPQEKRMRAHQSLINNLKKGVQVVTSGGIIGRVSSVETDHVVLEIANNVKIRLNTDNVSQI
ncbi:MAG: preprotein translocase subunit YajC, partial [Bdellovibrionales bacterium]|nr:preprotein translocase subunit YajC [Bdellovibrionales bacterium]